ncbi:MAG: C69 family dipeptidase, partial [Lachnospiraceae bacterium]|nr:C69 family dipeptidase [Lachnospiraceae bacterium]
MILNFDRFGKFKALFFGVLAIVGVSAFSGSSIIADACTLMYAGENRTEDGNVIFGRSEDSSVSFPKTFEKVQSAVHKEGEK